MDVDLGLLRLVIHVGDLAYTLVFRKLGVAMIGMQAAVDPTLGVSIVADVELESEAAANGNKFVEEFVVADEPWRHHGESGQCGRRHRNLPRAVHAVAAVYGPEAKQWHDGQHDRLG